MYIVKVIRYSMSFRANHDLPLRSHLPQTQKILRGTLQHCFLDPAAGEGVRHRAVDMESGVKGYLP